MGAVATDLAEEENVRKLQEASPPGLPQQCPCRGPGERRGQMPGLKNRPWRPSCGRVPSSCPRRRRREPRLPGDGWAVLLLNEELGVPRAGRACPHHGPPGGRRWPFAHTGLRRTRPGPGFNLGAAASREGPAAPAVHLSLRRFPDKHERGKNGCFMQAAALTFPWLLIRDSEPPTSPKCILIKRPPGGQGRSVPPPGESEGYSPGGGNAPG